MYDGVFMTRAPLALKSESIDRVCKCNPGGIRHTSIGFEDSAIKSWDDLSPVIITNQILEFLDALNECQMTSTYFK